MNENNHPLIYYICIRWVAGDAGQKKCDKSNTKDEVELEFWQWKSSRRPQNENDQKNEDNLEIEDNPKIEDFLKK